jgi:hypothetical protein
LLRLASFFSLGPPILAWLISSENRLFFGWFGFLAGFGSARLACFLAHFDLARGGRM